jgi:GNAT superfamily N-acetyltransferase
MSLAPRDGLIESPVLDCAERAALEELAEVCNRYEGLDLPLALGESAVQLVYYEAGVLLGYIELQDYAPKQMEVCGMVHPDHRRRGVGHSLLAGAQSECRARGQPGFLLVCDEAGPSGKAFASAAGARYRYSEHRMELDAVRRPRPTSGPLQLRRASEDDITDFVSIGAAAFQHDPAEIPERKERMTKGWPTRTANTTSPTSLGFPSVGSTCL